MKRNLFVAALTLCCSVLMFSAQPAFAESVTKEYIYSNDLAAPDPVALAGRVDGLSEYVANNGTNDLCYLIMDYGSDWQNYNNTSWLGDYAAYNYYYLNYFYLGKNTYPQSRYLYLYYVNDMQYDGAVKSGADKYLFDYDSAISPSYIAARSSSYITVYGQPLAAVWYSEDGEIFVQKNSFLNADSSATSSYTVYFSRMFNCKSVYDDNYTWWTLEKYYPVMLGVHDNNYDVTQEKLAVFNLCRNSTIKMSVTKYPIPTLDAINYTVTLPVPIGTVLGDFGAVLTSAFGFVSDTVILLCEYPVILVLLCIPLVLLAVSVFKSFTSR